MKELDYKTKLRETKKESRTSLLPKLKRLWQQMRVYSTLPCGGVRVPCREYEGFPGEPGLRKDAWPVMAFFSILLALGGGTARLSFH